MCDAPRASMSNAVPFANLSSVFKHDDVSSSPAPSSKASNKKCGACGNEGHTRASATEFNCPAYFDEKEVERREKARKKREQAIEEEKQKIRAIENESANAERMQAELARQIEELKRNRERAEDFRKEELKRRKQKVKRLEKRQNQSEG